MMWFIPEWISVSGSPSELHQESISRHVRLRRSTVNMRTNLSLWWKTIGTKYLDWKFKGFYFQHSFPCALVLIVKHRSASIDGCFCSWRSQSVCSSVLWNDWYGPSVTVKCACSDFASPPCPSWTYALPYVWNRPNVVHINTIAKRTSVAARAYPIGCSAGWRGRRLKKPFVSSTCHSGRSQQDVDKTQFQH